MGRAQVAASAKLAQVFPTIVHMLADAAARAPDREALVCDDVRVNYAQYLDAVAGFAAELRSFGGGNIALLAPNGIDACIATFAIHAAGAQATPLNPLYTLRELEQILRDAAPRAMIYDARREAELAPLLEALGIKARFALEADAASLLRYTGTGESVRMPSPDALAMLQYTGGTTGRAKGVELTHHATSANVAQRESLLPTGRHGERILCVMPLFHAYALAMGLYLAANAAGALIIRPRYQPTDVLDTIERERISIFPGSPTLFTGLMANASFATTDFSSIHTCYSGSAPLPTETLRRWCDALGAPVYEGYGQTEAGPVLTFNPAHGMTKAGSVGVPVAGTQVEIVDPKHGERILSTGEVGEIRARGPQLMRGYRNLPSESARALRDGWLYTGDLGELDEDGYLFIRDRLKDMVIVGGYNVYPREVDEVLLMHPRVLEAAAVGAPDDYRGEVVVAFVAPRAKGSLDAADLLEHCAANLARYKLPVRFEVMTALPKTTVGKVDKAALRELAAAPRRD